MRKNLVASSSRRIGVHFTTRFAISSDPVEHVSKPESSRRELDHAELALPKRIELVPCRLVSGSRDEGHDYGVVLRLHQGCRSIRGSPQDDRGILMADENGAYVKSNQALLVFQHANKASLRSERRNAGNETGEITDCQQELIH